LNKKFLSLSILSGLLLGFSWPVNGIVFLIFIGFVPLLIIENNLRHKSISKIFFYSLLTFIIWNIITCWWLIYSTTFGMVFAIVLYSLLMTLVFSSFSLISKKIGNKLGIIYFISSWIIYEKINLIWDFSWPSLILGNVFSESHHLIQWYEYTGSFGGTLWILVVNFIFFQSYNNYLNKEKSFKKYFSISLLAISIPLIISLYIYDNQTINNKKLDVSIIQPNIDPYNEKYGRTNINILKEFKDITRDDVFNNRIIFTPETYFSESPGYSLNNFFDSSFYNNLNSYLNNKNSELISGIQFYKMYNSVLSKSETSNYIKDSIWVDIYNSSFINSDLRQVYHKSKLVAGVENLPYKKILEPILGNLLLDFGGTISSRATQENRAVFITKLNNKVAPIICYESMYGEYVTQYVRGGAQFLAILTNDGWWNNSPGHKQLLSYSKIRAIETRRDIVRSANTGISAIINKKGDIVDSLDYNKKGFINSSINLSDKITFYVKYGDFIYRISLFFFLIIVLFYFSKRK
jgi:apolipoprotein N-acyltransferase|tara:strand:+ start:9388 stop:10947 length:1560 start_codon:yes stop_codon:yes gene_type:complete